MRGSVLAMPTESRSMSVAGSRVSFPESVASPIKRATRSSVAAAANSLIGCETTVKGGVTASVQSASSKEMSDTSSGIDRSISRSTFSSTSATELSVARTAVGRSGELKSLRTFSASFPMSQPPRTTRLACLHRAVPRDNRRYARERMKSDTLSPRETGRLKRVQCVDAPAQ
jgi:hypothetical protein